MVFVGSVVLGVEDVEEAIEFWSAALGADVHRFPDAENDFTLLIPPSGEGVRLGLQRCTVPAQEHPRVHLDLVALTAEEHASEVARLVGLGATRVAWDLYPDDPDFVVLADPSGNRFCVVDASHG